MLDDTEFKAVLHQGSRAIELIPVRRGDAARVRTVWSADGTTVVLFACHSFSPATVLAYNLRRNVALEGPELTAAARKALTDSTYEESIKELGDQFCALSR